MSLTGTSEREVLSVIKTPKFILSEMIVLEWKAAEDALSTVAAEACVLPDDSAVLQLNLELHEF